MIFFNRNKKRHEREDSVSTAIAEVDAQVTAAKKERAAVVSENVEARGTANDILRTNGFTLTLYLAAHNPKRAGQ